MTNRMKVSLPTTGQTDLDGNRLVLIPISEERFEVFRYPTYNFNVWLKW